MISVLVNAYACSPHWGSEPGMGWNWILALSKYCELYIITEGEWRDKIEEALSSLPQKDTIHFFYLPVEPWVREICWNQGDWRFYYYYRKWQERALEQAHQIMRQYPIDLGHQLNMIGFREPGYLWRIEGLPFVWGPVGGMNLFPECYLAGAGFKYAFRLRLKNVLNKLQMRYYPRVRNAVRRADALLAATPETQKVFQGYYQRDSFLISETGCALGEYNLNVDRYSSKGRLDLLWVGRFFYAKQLNIALETIANLRDLDVRLHIVGEGSVEETAYYKNLASSLSVDDKCEWYGKVPHEDVFKLMQDAHIFFFTSVSEATSTVVLEALQCNLPVICFDTCGFGAVVNEKIGRKIKLSDPHASARAFASVIRELSKNRGMLRELSANCMNEIQKLSWDYKAKQVLSIYSQVLKKYGG